MKIKMIVGAFAAVLLLTGCMGTGGDDTSRGVGDSNNIEKTRFNDSNRTNDITNNVSNRDNVDKRGEGDYDLSKEAADKIVSEIASIEQAYVFTTKNNAYVGAVLADHGDRSDNDLTKGNRALDGGNAEDLSNTNRDGTGIGDMPHAADNGHEVTDDVKEEIIRIVQETDGNIENVYVSTSPDFLNLAENYATDFESGRPISGLFDQIGNMIERAFPQNKR